MNAVFPKFTSSDKELNITYQYRCELYNGHIKPTPAGHVISEFLPDVPWAGIYNTISCAAMHHFRDGRWMQNTEPLTSYAKFWCTVGNPRLYSFPISDSVLQLEKVTGDSALANELYPQLTRIVKEWDDHKRENGMYRQDCNYDGMEYSISGDGFRPTINSYMAADFAALAKIANRVSDTENAEKYQKNADFLKDQINRTLWNDSIGMYAVVSDAGEMQNVKEQIGYIPWIYGIPTEGRDQCFENLLDPNCFLSPYGLRTADASHPDYRKPFDHECLWNGPIWPFATSQTLTALIEYLHSTKETVIGADDFTELLLTYARSHRDTDGTPWMDENMDPDNGIWLAREILRSWGREDKDRGQHYNHSTFIDLVMTGICGIRPSHDDRLTVHPLGTALDYFSVSDVPYHGHLLNIDWNKENGLKVTVDQTKSYCSKDGYLEIDL